MTRDVDLILSLNEQELEDVMAAVHIWCSRHDIALGTDLGRQALMIAARARLKTEASSTHLQKLISDELSDRHPAGKSP